MENRTSDEVSLDRTHPARNFFGLVSRSVKNLANFVRLFIFRALGYGVICYQAARLLAPLTDLASLLLVSIFFLFETWSKNWMSEWRVNCTASSAKWARQVYWGGKPVLCLPYSIIFRENLYRILTSLRKFSKNNWKR